MKKAVVLLSGGLDSTTCLAIAQSQGYDCIAISFNYCQRHAQELVAAQCIAKARAVSRHKIITIDASIFQHSALTDDTLTVPAYSGSDEIPSTYVPARNTLFLSYALALAESYAADDIFLGATEVDYSGYPDCREAYFDAFTTMANYATKRAVNGKSMRIHTPLLFMSKAETIKIGTTLGVDYAMTRSCYQINSTGDACGRCDACFYRAKGFKEAGIPDPTPYVPTTAQKIVRQNDYSL